MQEISKKILSELLSKKLGEHLDVTHIEKVGSGYHSDGYRVDTKQGKKFFLKKVKSDDLGFEYPERKIASLLTSHNMSARTNIATKPIGVMISSHDENILLPEIDDSTQIFHIQEFQEEHQSYWNSLLSKRGKTMIDAEDKKEIEDVVDILVAIHKQPLPFEDNEKKKRVYRDSLKSVITHPELTFRLLQDFPHDHPLLPKSRHKEYLGLMVDVMYHWHDKHDRLTLLHGDFWGANLFRRKDGSSYIVDFSRIPFGEPGIDVGWWLCQYLWYYHEDQNEYFKQLGEYFLETYITKTGDTDIRDAVLTVLGLSGIIFTSPAFFPNLNIDIGRVFLQNVESILSEKTFVWKELTSNSTNKKSKKN